MAHLKKGEWTLTKPLNSQRGSVRYFIGKGGAFFNMPLYDDDCIHCKEKEFLKDFKKYLNE